MKTALALIAIVSAATLALATKANWRTSLVFTVAWTWLAWGLLLIAVALDSTRLNYLALVVTGCAGVSVLGARRPGAASWQFVVVGLLVVLLLPWAESHFRGGPLNLGGVRLAFLAGVLAVNVLNYLPTRLSLAAAAVGAVCGSALFELSGTTVPSAREWTARLAGTCAAPALGWLGLWLKKGRNSPADRLWLDFRDRFGAIWSLRVLDQFNKSAANAGATTRLTWFGLEGPNDGEGLARLAALLKRFGL